MTSRVEPLPDWPAWRPTAPRTTASPTCPTSRGSRAYAEVPDGDGGTLRMAYVDAGPADGPVALLLHGEPTWSFLYRHVMRGARRAPGIRAVAPDLVGFGRSDKPTAPGRPLLRPARRVGARAGLRPLDLRDVTLVGQDWGGLIGLRLVAEHPDRFARVVAANTGLPTGDLDMPEVWWQFRSAVEKAEVLDVGRLVAAGCVAPARPTTSGRRTTRRSPTRPPRPGPRAMPTLVPTRPDDPATEANRAAWEVLTRWDKPFLAAFSDGDPITGAMAPVLRKLVPGAAGLDHPVIAGAGHFLQEDAGAELGRVVADFIGRALRA